MKKHMSRNNLCKHIHARLFWASLYIVDHSRQYPVPRLCLYKRGPLMTWLGKHNSIIALRILFAYALYMKMSFSLLHPELPNMCDKLSPVDTTAKLCRVVTKIVCLLNKSIVFWLLGRLVGQIYVLGRHIQCGEIEMYGRFSTVDGPFVGLLFVWLCKQHGSIIGLSGKCNLLLLACLISAIPWIIFLISRL